MPAPRREINPQKVPRPPLLLGPPSTHEGTTSSDKALGKAFGSLGRKPPPPAPSNATTEEVVEISEDDDADDSCGAKERAEHARLHAEWAKENRAAYPPSLPNEPEPGTVKEMQRVLEAAEAICRNFTFAGEPLRASCVSHDWNEALRKLQDKLTYMSRAAESDKWKRSQFTKLLRTASLIQMRPLHDACDKELLRAADGRCMVCGAREHLCQWAFDLASIRGKEGVQFLERPQSAGMSIAHSLKGTYDAPDLIDADSFYGRFTTGKTCLRKVHLAFWANNFFPYLFEWVDEQFLALNEDADDLDPKKFYVATAENALHFVREVEIAEHALRTDSATAPLPELPLRFSDKWKVMYDCFRGAHQLGWTADTADRLQRLLGERARKALRSGPNDTDDDEGVEDEDTEEEEAEDAASEADAAALPPGEGNVSSRTRLRSASPKQQQRQRAAGEAAPAEQRKASDVGGSDEEEQQPQPRKRRRTGGRRAQRVGSDDDGSDGGDGADDDLADAHGFSIADTEEAVRQSRTSTDAPKGKSPVGGGAGTGSYNHEASGSTDPPPKDEADEDVFEAAAQQIKAHAVNLVRAIGHELAAEAFRADQPNRAANRATLTDAIADRLERELREEGAS